ncbi:DUF305 domain-containing protein [Corynebacterium sp. 335C]
MKRTALAALLLTPTLALVGCGGDGADGAAGGADAPAKQVEQEAQARIADEHNDADVTFARMMIPHHEQALEMSRILLSKPDPPPRVAELAQRIQDEQGPEITRLNAMLETWGEPAVPPAPGGMAAEPAPAEQADHSGDGGHSHHADGAPADAAQMDPAVHGEEAAPEAPAPQAEHVMPGMLTPEELAAIDAAGGEEASRLYLEGMIAHHQSAIDMARAELDGGSNEQAKELAQQIVDAQEPEIAIMRGILDSL